MNLTHFLIVAAALTAFLTTACDPATVLGPQAERADNYDLRVRYHRGSCYGRCEVYTLNVYDNGLLVFEGERFTDRPGTWQKSIDRRRVNSLLDSFAMSDFANYPRSFRGEIPDAATIEVTYYDDEGKSYQTSFKDSAPAELQILSNKLHDLAHLPNYRLVSDTIAGTKKQPVAAQERQEIIVQLKEGITPEAWVVAYSKQNVRIKSRISPRSPYYVITADPNVMAAEELLEFLRQDKDVVSAQLNQEVRPRR
ncbi:hypothetical protein FUA23_17245 [Neolewinella aurantiaca]|uniref:DUF6438 domain-containing protein n=1 Tax=Neolewinella aurantiaca TaxID=2602767 RepID=A0A5C7FSV8_9BACT|nr:DUF6438 domain-containing protein [Neolewinella aurantiaca]TXF87804.1 hypothetical protein FUA23_17245 [Neolewinella aurantiaca]